MNKIQNKGISLLFCNISRDFKNPRFEFRKQNLCKINKSQKYTRKWMLKYYKKLLQLRKKKSFKIKK